MEWIDLRSDTFTRPTPAMRQEMFEAEVGDDVFGEDPTVNRLEKMVAGLFGKEAALFCPSGTMTNQIAIKVHTQPGDEVICDVLSHVYQYEGGGIAFNAGCSVKLLQGDRGRISASQVEEAINPFDIHKANSRLVVLENTSNRGGGACYRFEDIESIAAVCKENGLSFHLDGARLWNAMVANGENTLQYGKVFDSISVCMSKGLGAPVGSLLIGSQEFIDKARRVRKVFGGGMRQAGYLAAACIHALHHHRQRLEHDHAHARKTAEALAKQGWVKEVLPAETNIVLLHTTRDQPAKFWVAKLKEKGILCLPVGPYSIRVVFHLDVSADQAAYVEYLVNTLN